MKLFRLTSEVPNGERFPHVKYVVAQTIVEAMKWGVGFPGAMDVAKVEVLSDEVSVIL